MINDPSSHSHNICGIEINTLPGSSSGGNHDIPQLARMEKRKRTNYSLGGNKAKIEEAVKYLLELSERARPNVRNVAEKVFHIPPPPFFYSRAGRRWVFLTTPYEIISRKLKVLWPLLEELSSIILWLNTRERRFLKNIPSNLSLNHLLMISAEEDGSQRSPVSSNTN
jgi:hypothetical protein